MPKTIKIKRRHMPHPLPTVSFDPDSEDLSWMTKPMRDVITETHRWLKGEDPQPPHDPKPPDEHGRLL